MFISNRFAFANRFFVSLHKMIDDGMLPYAKFDDYFKTLILTDRMYSRYSYIKMYGNSFDVTVDDKRR